MNNKNKNLKKFYLIFGTMIFTASFLVTGLMTKNFIVGLVVSILNSVLVAIFALRNEEVCEKDSEAEKYKLKCQIEALERELKSTKDEDDFYRNHFYRLKKEIESCDDISAIRSFLESEFKSFD
jgi:septal ring factor EnvC (AmiA/AmiB activator)